MDEFERLFEKIKTLNERLWDNRAPRPLIEAWLENFLMDHARDPSEQLHALFLLSQFIYFADREVRELLRALYRDHYRYPIVEEARRAANETKDAGALQRAF